MARRYDRGTFRSEAADGTPIPSAVATVWDAKAAGTQLTNLATVADDGTQGDAIPGGQLVCDEWGYVPSFYDLDDSPEVWIIGAATGVIDGVDRVHLDPTDTDDRVLSLESTATGYGTRIAALEARPEIDAISDLVASTFNVADYGATAGSGTDASPGIQGALDAAYAAGSGVVLIPPGSYSINTTLVVRANTTVRAHGAHITRAAGKTIGLLNNFASGDSVSGYAGHCDIRIEGGIWDSDAANNTGWESNMTFGHAERIALDGVTIRNTSYAHGVELNSIRTGKVIGCVFEGFVDTSGDSSRQMSEAIQLDGAINSNHLVYPDYDDTMCYDIEVIGCTMRASDTCGPYGALVGDHGGVASFYHEQIRIIGNHVDSPLTDGVHARGFRRYTIADNTIVSPVADGIYAEPSYSAVDGAVIRGNVITSPGRDGIRVAGVSGTTVSRPVITGNSVLTPVGDGVHVSYIVGGILGHNMVSSPGAYGIYAEYSSYLDIDTNSVISPTGGGVKLAGSGECLVRGNTVYQGSDHQIYMGTGPDDTTVSSDCAIEGNFLQKPAASKAAVRLDTGVVRTGITLNKINKSNGTGAAVSTALAASHKCFAAGNDLSTFSTAWTAATAFVADSGTTAISTSWPTAAGANQL